MATYSRIQSLYDVLKVTPDAPFGVIRAAYRSLSQRAHPDLHGGDDASVAHMTELNNAYATLSDPARRRAHDAELEYAFARDNARGRTASSETGWAESFMRQPADAHVRSSPLSFFWYRRVELFLRARRWYLCALALGLVGIIGWLMRMEPAPQVLPFLGPPLVLLTAPSIDHMSAYDASSATIHASGEASRPADRAVDSRPPHGASVERYLRPVADPYGQPWPTVAGYIGGRPILVDDALGVIVLDNRQGAADVFAKIVEIVGKNIYVRRSVFVPAHAVFIATSIDFGRYDVRYQELSSGRYAKSRIIRIERLQQGDRVIPMRIAVPLADLGKTAPAACEIAEEEF